MTFHSQQGLGAFSAPRWVLILVTAYLLVTWSLVVLVDFLNVGGIQASILEKPWPLPMLWHRIFGEGGWTERAQWLLLGAAAVCVFSLWRWTRREKVRELDLPLLLLAAGTCLMLIEGSLDFRHVVADRYLAPLFSEGELPRMARMGWEMSYYLVLSILMAGSLVVVLLHRRFSQGTYLLIVAAYGLVGFGSALRRLGDWPENLGSWLVARFDLADLPAWNQSLARIAQWRETVDGYSFTLGHLLVDHLVEGSLGLLAAGFLLAAFLALRAEILDRDDVNGARREAEAAETLFRVVRRGLDTSSHRTRRISASLRGRVQ